MPDERPSAVRQHGALEARLGGIQHQWNETTLARVIRRIPDAQCVCAYVGAATNWFAGATLPAAAQLGITADPKPVTSIDALLGRAGSAVWEMHGPKPPDPPDPPEPPRPVPPLPPVTPVPPVTMMMPPTPPAPPVPPLVHLYRRRPYRRHRRRCRPYRRHRRRCRQHPFPRRPCRWDKLGSPGQIGASPSPMALSIPRPRPARREARQQRHSKCAQDHVHCECPGRRRHEHHKARESPPFTLRDAMHRPSATSLLSPPCLVRMRDHDDLCASRDVHCVIVKGPLW